MDNVVEMGEFLLTHTDSKYESFRENRCGHHSIEIDSNGGIVTCKNCKKQLDPLNVLEMIVSRKYLRSRGEDARIKALEELEERTVSYRAARTLETIWRSRKHGKQIPCCPHCERGIMPEDITDKPYPKTMSYELERARREKNK